MLSQVLLIMWFEGEVLPINLANVIAQTPNTDSEDDDDCYDSVVDDGPGINDFLQD